MSDLTHQGKVALITGASRGIGLAVATELVERGARVCITGRKTEALHTAVDALGGREVAIAVSGRADDPDHQSAAVASVMEAFGRIDYLVNNAGINPHFGPLLTAEPSAASKCVDVNCLAPIAWIRRVHEAWMEEHGGGVVNISSIAGVRPAANIGLYGATKAMLNYLTHQLALELGPRIRVNAVAPGIVKTDFAAKLYEGREREVAATYPLGRLGVSADVAESVSFLLSDASSWMTGQVIVLDGGVTLRGME
jgi:NAD(P)-dependent dehydrogenase (short-subunit alcohol dehydrogenase family)